MEPSYKTIFFYVKRNVHLKDLTRFQRILDFKMYRWSLINTDQMMRI